MKPFVQQYAWGNRGKQSTVANLFISDANSIPDAPFAELWMGTHPNGPSQVLFEDGKTLPLKEHLSADLPFLFKVLSVGSALSIQAHPNKQHAQLLHQQFPAIYKDPNHKPEMAFALTDFEMLCGFRPLAEIVAFLQSVPEFRAVVGEEVAKQFIEAPDSKQLHRLFSAIMKQDSAVVTDQLHSLVDRLQSHKGLLAASQPPLLCLRTLILTLSASYPTDVGCFAPFFLNAFTLSPCQAVFLSPNLPHAYLSGDCIECMACSDNVVRAGLTPKFIDVNTLCEMLVYESSTIEMLMATPHQIDSHSLLFADVFPEFQLIRTAIAAGQKLECPSLSSHSILLCFQGSGSIQSDQLSLSFHSGSVLLIHADSVFLVCADTKTVLFRCSEKQ